MRPFFQVSTTQVLIVADSAFILSTGVPLPYRRIADRYPVTMS